MLLSVVGLAALAACSTSQMKFAHVPYEGFGEMAQPFKSEIESQKREPSNTKARVVWESDTLKIPLTAGSTVNKSYNVRFNQVHYYEVPVRRLERVPYETVRWVLGSKDVLVCRDVTTGGAGQSLLWNAFYSAPKEQKATKLADAIAGVGVPTAKKLVAGGYFHSKPRSWQAFEDEIRRAKNAGTIDKQIEYEVLYNHRNKNMENLGYDTQTSGVCAYERQDYYYPVPSIEYRDEWVTRMEPRRDVISVENREYNVNISGSRLQTFESEMMILSFDHDSNQVTVGHTEFNNYSVSMDGNSIVIRGVSRKNINLPSAVFAGSAVLEKSGGSARFSTPINRQYLPKSGEGELVIRMVVRSCKKGSFGSCAVFGKDEREEFNVVQTVTGQVHQHQFPILNGRTYWISYYVNLVNSPWYVNNVVKGPSAPTLKN